MNPELIAQIAVVLKYLIAGISVAIMVVVLLQVREGGLGTTFGGSSSSGEVYRSRRGLEAWLYNSTIVLITGFAVAAFVLAAISTY